jgi:hypothetical protein
MKTLYESILESTNIAPTKIKDTDSYKEIWYQNLETKFKKSYQQSLIDGYLSSVQRNHWDDSDKKSEIKRWERAPFIFDKLSAKITQFGNQNPIMNINISAYNPTDKYNNFNTTVLYIKMPNRTELSIEELTKLADTVIDKINSKTTKVIKYMSDNWSLPNEYTDYDKFIKL